ncbi:GNAT family N-acetyltransferase [Acidaminobacter sp. JC074]|uniref:GNAT family N-acetyltransferase n=1 Tax=Acidaminobacter sp. JC074 TaxID=2530199 RepID=UPI001F0E8835|nr:GNAT family N-acetyltransferase [Acidaminobacter sp. JC074]
MKYIEDKNKRYEKDIIKHLRAHNNVFVGNRRSGSSYFYALKNKTVIGRLHNSLFWDWVSLNDIFYEDLACLSSLLDKVSHYYDDYIGLKHYTDKKSDEKSLIKLGFEIGGYTASTPKTPTYTYLKSLNRNFKVDEDLDIICSKNILDQYEPHKKQANKSHTSHVYFVALDKTSFAGGIHAIIEEDSMYISRLAIPPDYKKQGIGTKLMRLAEERAYELGLYNITTGTCSFQAKDFYEKLGYKILFTKENDPKGYDSYSLEKKLQKEQND